MVSIIHTWQFNPLSLMFAQPKLKLEVNATMRRVFAQMAVVRLYSEPYHYCYEYDEDGQWADDGGRNCD